MPEENKFKSKSKSKSIETSGGSMFDNDSPQETKSSPSFQSLPLSSAQQGIWFAQQVNPDAASHVFKIAEYFDINGVVDTSALEQAIRQTVSEAQAYQVTIHEVEDECVQTCSLHPDWHLPILDMSGDESPFTSALEWMQRDIDAPMDLSSGPLFSFAIIKLDSSRTCLYQCVHHIINDGLGGHLFIDRVLSLYNAAIDNTQSAGHATFGTLQEVQQAELHYLESERFSKDKDFWVNKYQQRANSVSLSGKTAACLSVYRYQNYLSTKLTSQLRDLASRYHVTLPQLLVSLLGGYLYRMTGQESMLVGFPVSGRRNKALRSTPTMAVNVVPVELNFSPETTLEQSLSAIKRDLFGALKHQDYRSEALKAELGLFNEQHPLFSTLINIVPFKEQIAFGQAPATVHNLSTGPTDDLSITLYERGLDGGLELSIAANTALYSDDEVDAHGKRMVHFLAAAVANANGNIHQLDIALPSEKQSILQHFNDTKTPFSAQSGLHELIEQQVNFHPNAPALDFNGVVMSYAQLNQKANQLAHWLQDHGVQATDRVAISLPRNCELIVAVLATLKVGATYVPMDPNYPLERRLYMVKDCQPKVILTLSSSDLFTQSFSSATLVVDFEEALQESQSLSNGNLSMGEFDSQQLAYLIYTSGSTGHPKGVMLSHRNACNLVEWAISEYGPKLFSRTLFSTSLNFDLSVYEIFSTLSCGGCLVIVENALSLLEKEYDLTLINTVPSALSALVDGNAIPSSVQVVNVAGEPLKKELAQRFFELTPIPSLCNLYAPSETTTYSTFVRMYRGQPFAPHIGKPLNNTQVYILDAQQKLLPPGVIGEIYIGGEGVAQGYINLSAMTEERFVSDPFASDGKAKMYKTGDLGRWTTDGNIEFLGRNDFQVKIRGFRIELGEIESTLLSHPAVDNAVVVAQEDVNGQPQLVAYYTLTKAVNVEQLIEFVSQPLADYMVPAAMVALDTMPLTQNGKVDRKALPAPNASAFVSAQYVEPKGENEQRLASIWQQLIGIEKISRNDNFFQIGGHSLLAARLISRLRSEFGTELSLAQIFNHPTLKAMAKILVQSSVVSQLPDIVPTHEGDRYPLTFAQKGLWLLEQLDGSSLVAYVMKNSVEFHGPLDFSALEVAFLTVIERHAPLRTKFISVDGQPLQQIMPAPDSFVIQRDGEFVVEFDLNEGYLIRAHIAEQDPNIHTLTIAMHHIISDGWSTRIILNELIAAYNSELSGAPLDLDSLPIQYGDYARWQQTHYQGEWYENQKSYWFEQLEGIPECVSLPLDFVRPEQQNYAGLTFPITIDHELTQNIKALAQRHHSTLYMTLLASFSLLIGRLSNQTDVVIGTPIAGRNRTELEDLVGMFVNTQALRVNLDQVTDVSSLIHQVKATVLKAQTNQDVSFEQIVEAVAPNRNMAHNPIYQVIFALHNTPNQLAQMQDVDVQVVMGDSDTAQFDLSVGLYEVDGQLSGYVNFATALFKQETVERFMACWHTLLSHMVQQDTLQPLALPMLPEQEQQRVVEHFNRGKQDFFSHVTITQRFEEQAERFADRIAVSYENNHLTYAQLNARANQLAHWLMANGVKPDSRVAIALERSEKLLIAILATLKAGGAYVPLDPNYPQERLQYSLQDSEPEVVITTSALVDKLGNLPVNTQLALLDKPEWLDLTIDNIAAECSGLTAQHMAYIIYTSGSTGKPKGVMVEHHNVMRLMAATQGDFQFNERDVWTLFHSYAFDFSVWEIWGALLFGGRLVVVPHLVSRAPDDFYQLLCNEQVTVLNQTPSAFRQLIAAQSEQPHDLRYVIFGGEALELSALSPWYQKSLNRHTQLINMYGITETTVHTTYYPLTAADVYRTGASPIGRGLNDLRLYILDEFRQPVPVGVTGELYVSGAGVARGYLNRAELTAERFMLDPFVADGQTRMYKSGDLGRWLDDGSIEYLGRNDDQVKIRGFRIELGEIEACVRSFDQVQDAAVIAAPNASGDYHIVAYYVSEPAQSAFDLEALRAHVADLVPNYMVPSAWMQLDVMPLTGNGKLDRRALPEVTTQDVVRHAYQAPQTDNEMLLASLWSELLGVEQIGRQDNFFELGGHSLLAVQLMAMLREHHCDIAVKHLFNQPDLASLAATMDPSEDSHVVIEENRIPQGCDSITPEMLPLANLSQESIDGICAQVSGGASNVQDIYPLAPLQEGILFHHLVQEQGDAYLTRFITGFSTESQLDAFLSGLQAVINRHDILRTAVAWQGLNQPMQVVWREAKMPIQTLSFDQQSQATGESVAECLQRHFDPATTRIELSAAPLIHAYRVYDQQEQRWLLCLLIHHLINDHTTLELLVEEVFAHIDGRTDQLLEPVPFRQFIGQIERRRDADREREYFTAQLADIDEPCAPFGLLNVQNSAQDIEQSTTYIDSASAVQLRQLAKQHNVSTASMFHLAWSMVLRAATGRHDVVFGTVLFGRMGAGINSDRTLGMFLNTVPLRLTLADQSASQLVAMTHQALAELLDYEHASLIMTQQCSGVAAQTPLFTSLLNYRYQGGSDAQAKILDRIDLVFSAEQTNYPISLDINDHASGEFSFDLHVDRTIGCERVAIMLNNAINQLVDALANSSENSFNPSILGVAERTQVLEGFNQTERDFPTDTCIHHRIEQTAAHYANDIAVVDEDKQLTFAELNAQANQLAHWLVQQGVTPDSRVGVSLDRSCELVVALVAILKAGGAYVPMDPGYPEDRLEYMVQDSRPVVLLTTCELRPRLGQVPSDVQIAYFEGALPWANEATTNLDPASLGLSARSLAYLIYTSGSTGKPKGVMNEHRGVVNRLSWMAEDYGFSRDDVILQKTPFSFDVSVWEFFCPLWVGATLVMAKPEGHKDPQYLRELIERRQVSILHFVPPMLQMFLEGCESGDCPSLRLMFCSGEALPAETIRRTYQMLPHIELHNLYGPTEAAVDVTQWHCPRDLAGDRVSIGSSVANTRMYVLDAQGQPAPVGVAGEIFIGGIQVARGYLNRDDLTAERFVRDPFVAEGTMYKTGDVGRWLPDGTIEYQGRNDDQVKIRGFRVELGEISSALKGCQAVLEAVVIAKGSSANKRLIGYFTSESDLSIEALKAEMGERLPEYMVPAALVQIAEIPLTPNGKMDRKALPEPSDDAFVRRDYVAPQGEVENELATIWQTLLDTAQVGRFDNFFELGGHSLLAIQLIEQLRQRGYQLAVKALFDQPVLAELAQTLTGAEQQDWQIPNYSLPANGEQITPDMLPLVDLNQEQIAHIAAQVAGGMVNIQDIYPLATLQEGILYHHRLQQERDPYISPVILSFATEQEVVSFTQALQKVIDRHDILRTSMAWESLEEPVQVVWRSAVLPVTQITIDAQALADGDVLNELTRRANGDYAHLDVTQAPLMAAYHTEDSVNNRWLLCLINHHLNSDHTTMELLVEEVFAHMAGREAELPTPLPFRDFVATSRFNANSEQHQAFFTEQFADIDEPCAPFDVLDLEENGAVDVSHLGLNAVLSQRIRAMARKQGVSPAAMFHLAWGLVLKATSGRSDVVFGTVLFGRMSAGQGASRVLGMFLNTLPLKLTLSDVTLESALHDTHQSLATLLDYEHASLSLAQQCSGLVGGAPLFSSLMNYRYAGGSAQLDSIESSMDIVYSAEHSNYPVTLSVNDHITGEFSLDLQIDQRLQSRGIDTMLVAALEQISTQLVSGLDVPTHQLSVLPQAQYHQLVHQLNQTTRVVDQVSCVHQLFERQVEMYPDQLAVVSADRQLTYAELNAQANQLAHWLVQQGVGVEDRVALCFDRSPALIVAMLATLKAGAGYVPIDPAYPAERIRYMVDDSQPLLMLTDGTVDMAVIWDTQSQPVREVNVIRDRHLWADSIAENLAMVGRNSANLAYVIYTSGSTGQPKGVMVEHHNLANLIAWHNQAFDIQPNDCVSSVAGLGFDAAVWEIWPPLCAGAYLTLPTLEISKDPEQLLAWWVQQPIKVGFLSTPVAELSFARGVHPSTLKTLLVGGDKLTRQPHANAPYQLVNNYGPTETTVVATSGVIKPTDTRLHIGKGITNTQLYLLDEHGQLVPRGVTGELYIGGLGVARGYMNRNDLTAERFLPDPHRSESGARMYRTGDLARWLEDGTLEYQGRNDDQVKIRGFRIELGEIDVALKRCAGVDESIVIAQETPTGDKRLVAYFVGDAQREAIRDQLAEQLPQYMVPVAYVSLSSMPLTANGKIDRRSLPDPDVDAFITHHYEAPEGEIEQRLAELWCELLGVKQVGRHDHFFELGGHSLLAVKLITRIRDAFNVELAISDLFAQPTLAELGDTLLQRSMTDIDMEELKAMALAAGYDESELDLVLAQLADNELV